MLSKCANPGCGALFRYLNEGKVYVAEWCNEGDVCVLAESTPSASRRWNRLEMFWLCGACDRTMTLTARANEVVPMPRSQLMAHDRPLRELRISG